jgi:hypothetical protein
MLATADAEPGGEYAGGEGERMKHDYLAWVIKVAAIVTAAPRWIGALLAAEGFALARRLGYLVGAVVCYPERVHGSG